MRLLVTGAACLLGSAVRLALPASTPIRAVDIAFAGPIDGAEMMPGDLRDADFVAHALDGVTTILHLAPLATRLDDDTASLDHATRGTYQLALAAAEAGVAAHRPRQHAGPVQRAVDCATASTKAGDRVRSPTSTSSARTWPKSPCARSPARPECPPSVCAMAPSWTTRRWRLRQQRADLRTPAGCTSTTPWPLPPRPGVEDNRMAAPPHQRRR